MNDPKLTRDRCLTEALHAPAVTPASLKYISSSSENVSLRRDHEKASRSARPTIDIVLSVPPEIYITRSIRTFFPPKAQRIPHLYSFPSFCSRSSKGEKKKVG